MALYFSFRLLIRYRCLVVSSTKRIWISLKFGLYCLLPLDITSGTWSEAYIAGRDNYFSKFLHKVLKCLLFMQESDITNRGLILKIDLPNKIYFFPNKIYYNLNIKKTTSLTLFFRALVCGLSCKIILYLTEQDLVNPNIKEFSSSSLSLNVLHENIIREVSWPICEITLASEIT